jgi:hypothetical protein
MRKPIINDRVRLICEIPQMSLHAGETGIVRSIWMAPRDCYEIEFASHESEPPDRCVVPADLIEIDEPTEGDGHD